jgi:peroxiredoxin
MISPLPGVTETKPGSAMRGLPGIGARVIDEKGVIQKIFHKPKSKQHAEEIIEAWKKIS